MTLMEALAHAGAAQAQCGDFSYEVVRQVNGQYTNYVLLEYCHGGCYPQLFNGWCRLQLELERLKVWDLLHYLWSPMEIETLSIEAQQQAQ